MQPRLSRLSEVLGDPLFDSILWGDEYDMDGLDPELRQRIEAGHYERIVFYGMGCSSVVSDVVKGFFLVEGIPIQVDVINDYQFEWFVNPAVLADDRTLVIIVCYSGWSVEPCLFYDKMKALTDSENLIVLSGGGKIAGMCQEDGTSLIQYQMRHADREYPLYHVQQFFSIFLNLFHKLGITSSTYEERLQNSVAYLKGAFDDELLQRAEDTAAKLLGSRIVLLGTADWYVTLLKQTTMFFNEIAMVPTHRNLLHEFSHTEVATYSDPTEKQAIVILSDTAADDYTKAKIQTLHDLFGDKSVEANRNIEIVEVNLDQDDFLKKFYFGHFFMVQVAYALGRMAEVEGRDLISIAAKNPWWSQRAIDDFPVCVDIPAELGEAERAVEPASRG
jgi:glucose/mannose-6-phosphate isomerase